MTSQSARRPPHAHEVRARSVRLAMGEAPDALRKAHLLTNLATALDLISLEDAGITTAKFRNWEALGVDGSCVYVHSLKKEDEAWPPFHSTIPIGKPDEWNKYAHQTLSRLKEKTGTPPSASIAWTWLNNKARLVAEKKEVEQMRKQLEEAGVANAQADVEQAALHEQLKKANAQCEAEMAAMARTQAAERAAAASEAAASEARAAQAAAETEAARARASEAAQVAEAVGAMEEARAQPAPTQPQVVPVQPQAAPMQGELVPPNPDGAGRDRDVGAIGPVRAPASRFSCLPDISIGLITIHLILCATLVFLLVGELGTFDSYRCFDMIRSRDAESGGGGIFAACVCYMTNTWVPPLVFTSLMSFAALLTAFAHALRPAARSMHESLDEIHRMTRDGRVVIFGLPFENSSFDLSRIFTCVMLSGTLSLLFLLAALSYSYVIAYYELLYMNIRLTAMNSLHEAVTMSAFVVVKTLISAFAILALAFATLAGVIWTCSEWARDMFSSCAFRLGLRVLMLLYQRLRGQTGCLGCAACGALVSGAHEMFRIPQRGIITFSCFCGHGGAGGAGGGAGGVGFGHADDGGDGGGGGGDAEHPPAAEVDHVQVEPQAPEPEHPEPQPPEPQAQPQAQPPRQQSGGKARRRVRRRSAARISPESDDGSPGSAARTHGPLSPTGNLDGVRERLFSPRS